MRKAIPLIVFLLLIATVLQPLTALADNTPSGSGVDELVQKGLTVSEIDKELKRLKQEDSDLSLQINDTNKRIGEQDKRVSEKRQHAAIVLRAYYLGDRDSLWVLLFSLKSFSDVLRTFEYLSMIVASDHQALSEFTAEITSLKQLKQQLSDTQTKLHKAQEDYLSQRDRLIRLQDELQQQLAQSAQAKDVMKRIDEVNEAWQSKGFPLFQSYFGALAEAMKGLPELAVKRSNGKSHLTIDGLSATFQITDTDLNDFLRAKNPLFEKLTFRFIENGLEADGQQDDITLSMRGAYQLDNSKKTIVFHFSDLKFNGYELPDTTVRNLEQQVDLGFNPKSYISFLEPTEIKQEAGKLSVKFKLNL